MAAIKLQNFIISNIHIYRYISCDEIKLDKKSATGETQKFTREK